MNEFNIFIELNKHGKIPTISKKRIIKYIELLDGHCISFNWIYDNNRISTFSIYSILRFEKKYCAFKNLIIKNILFYNERKISQIAKRKIKKLKFIVISNDKKTFDEDIIKMAFENEPKSCKFNSCLGKSIFINKNNEISICPFVNNNISLNDSIDIKEIKDIFNTESFFSIISKSINKRSKCKKTCKYYYLCKGGCPLLEIDDECNILYKIESVEKSKNKSYYKEQIIEKLANEFKG